MTVTPDVTLARRARHPTPAASPPPTSPASSSAARSAVMRGAAARWTLLSALVLVTIITCLVGYGQKLPCRDVGNWTHNYQYTRVCYSDILPLYSTEKLNEGKVPYVDQPVEYPVLIGAAMEAGVRRRRRRPRRTTSSPATRCSSTRRRSC